MAEPKCGSKEPSEVQQLSVMKRRPTRRTCTLQQHVLCLYAERLQHTNGAPNIFDATVHDLSQSGLCLTIAWQLYRDEVLHLRLQLPTGTTWFRGEVVWSESHDDASMYRTGIQLKQRISKEEALSNVELSPSDLKSCTDSPAG